MSDDVTVARADLEAVLGDHFPTTYLASNARIRLRDALTPPEPPWEPSEADIDAAMAVLSEHFGLVTYSKVALHVWEGQTPLERLAGIEAMRAADKEAEREARSVVAHALQAANDATPRRLSPTPLTDEQRHAWNLGISVEALRAAGWTIEPPS